MSRVDQLKMTERVSSLPYYIMTPKAGTESLLCCSNWAKVNGRSLCSDFKSDIRSHLYYHYRVKVKVNYPRVSSREGFKSPSQS